MILFSISKINIYSIHQRIKHDNRYYLAHKIIFANEVNDKIKNKIKKNNEYDGSSLHLITGPNIILFLSSLLLLTSTKTSFRLRIFLTVLPVF